MSQAFLYLSLSLAGILRDFWARICFLRGFWSVTMECSWYWLDNSKTEFDCVQYVNCERTRRGSFGSFRAEDLLIPEYIRTWPILSHKDTFQIPQMLNQLQGGWFVWCGPRASLTVLVNGTHVARGPEIYRKIYSTETNFFSIFFVLNCWKYWMN